jgi:hypothetical protein
VARGGKRSARVWGRRGSSGKPGRGGTGVAEIFENEGCQSIENDSVDC